MNGSRQTVLTAGGAWLEADVLGMLQGVGVTTVPPA
jgi:hypothetical protein